MSAITPDDLESYVDAHLAPRDPTLAAVEAQGVRERWPIVGPAEGTLLHLLTRLARSRRALELGTAIGYSTTWIARGLERGGELVTVEWNPDTAKVAAENLARTGVADRVRILVGDARVIVQDLAGPFDFVFNDIDKEGYPAILPFLVERLRVGGVLATDNVLWGGDVARKRRSDKATRAIRAYNDALAADPRFASVIVPIRDGLSVALKVRD
ncbi:MAG TPA: O-methyltransferase [Thermoplasmata archaeon]|nr:O-methyltransferase [Thermoplasmata archaeon]